MLKDYLVTPDGAVDLSRSLRSFSSLDMASLGLEPLLDMSLGVPVALPLVPPALLLPGEPLPGTIGLVSETLLPVLPLGLPGAPGPWALRMGSPSGEDFEWVVSALGLHAESDSAKAATAGSRKALR